MCTHLLSASAIGAFDEELCQARVGHHRGLERRATPRFVRLPPLAAGILQACPHPVKPDYNPIALSGAAQSGAVHDCLTVNQCNFVILLSSIFVIKVLVAHRGDN